MGTIEKLELISTIINPRRDFLDIRFRSQYFSKEMIEEIHLLFNFLLANKEISLVLFRGPLPYRFHPSFFSLGTEDIHRFYLELQKAMFGIRFLPQTTVCDWGTMAHGLEIDFGFSCDFQSIQEEGELHFSHVEDNLSLSYFTIPILIKELGSRRTRNYLLGQSHVKAKLLKKMDLLRFTYSSREEQLKQYKSLLKHVRTQNSLFHIQSKQAFLQDFLTFIASQQKEMNKIAYASVLVQREQNTTHH